MATVAREVSIKMLPKRLQRLINLHRFHTKQAASYEKSVERAGFNPSDYDYKRGVIDVAYKRREKAETKVKSTFVAKKSAVAQLRHAATVATLGLTPNDARPVLVKLAAELKKV